MASKTFKPGMYRCPACGNPFPRDYAWKKVCLDCYLERKGTRKAAPHRPEQPTAPPIELDMIRRLLQLAHPDKHGNSQAATEATRYLLELKRAAQAG
jgi:hypothetical protein